MTKTGYKNAIRGTAMVKVDLDANGNIAVDDEVAVSTKTINFTVTNADNDLTANETFTNLFLDWVGANAQNSTQKFRVTWEV